MGNSIENPVIYHHTIDPTLPTPGSGRSPRHSGCVPSRLPPHGMKWDHPMWCPGQWSYLYGIYMYIIDYNCRYLMIFICLLIFYLPEICKAITGDDSTYYPWFQGPGEQWGRYNLLGWKSWRIFKTHIDDHRMTSWWIRCAQMVISHDLTLTHL